MKKEISYVLLILYTVFLCNTYVFNENLALKEGIGFSLFKALNELSQQHTIRYLVPDILLKISAMIPFGILLPMARQKKCYSFTMTAGIITGFVFEMLQSVKSNGFVCFDDVLWAVIGTYIGYKLFLLLCKKTSDGFHYLRTFDNNKSKKWLIYLFVTFFFFCVISVTVYGLPAIPDVSNQSAGSLPTSNDDIYNTFYHALAAYETSVTFFQTSSDTDIIGQKYTKVLNEHPELFWVTGGGHYEILNINNMSVIRFYPDMEGDIKDIPMKEAQLNQRVDTIVAEASKLYTSYEKAKYVHDYIILNCQYDLKTYNIISSSQNIELTNYATTAYGCLVNGSAVCEGYAKAYKLILDRLGIECGYVEGTADNDSGSGPEGHAWNYIKINGTYSFVDVTWDDPVSMDGTSNNLVYDYFCISADELLKNHTIDEGQELPTF